MATTLDVLHPKSGRRASTVRPTVLAVLHPKGGVGRSTTVWQLGAELALRGKRVRIEDLDQGRQLSRVFERHPLGLEGLQLASSPMGETDADVILLDTAPEAQRERALEILRRADWLLVPVKGPEEGSVQALPALLKWLQEADGARLLGFVPTMHKPRVSRCATGSASYSGLPSAPTRVASSRSAIWRAWQPGAWTAIRTPAWPRRSCMPRALRAVPRATFDELATAFDAQPAIDDRIVHLLPIAAIQPNPHNPRRHLDNIDELAQSLRTHGLLQPVVVRRRGASYELILGHRRYEAAKLLGWSEIAASVRDETPKQAYVLALVENLQREDLTPKELSGIASGTTNSPPLPVQVAPAVTCHGGAVRGTCDSCTCKESA